MRPIYRAGTNRAICTSVVSMRLVVIISYPNLVRILLLIHHHQHHQSHQREVVPHLPHQGKSMRPIYRIGLTHIYLLS